MKKLWIIALMIIASFSLAACDKDVATPVPVPELSGDADITIEVGTPYNEQGLKDLTEGITITGTVDIDTVGDYVISYTYTEDSGAEASITRTVHVVDTTSPVITLVGSDLSLKVGDSYSDEGARAIDNYDGDISDSITVVDTVDTSVADSYTVTYTVTDDNGNTATKVRTVIVSEIMNEAPVISLIGEANVSLYVGETFTDEGASASDAEDGVLTSDIVVNNTVNTSMAGTYTVTYDVVDSKGLAATTVTRTVLVLVDQAPVITLNGEATVNLVQGDSYVEAGATATDTEDGNLDSSIVITGTVDTSVVGSYTISYDLVDSYGNNAVTVTRSVIVVANDIPVLTLVGASEVSILIGETYTEAGAIARDTEDGNLDSSVVVSGTVDTSVAATYTVTYDVTDSFGNVAQSITRTVIVRTNTVPVISLVGNDITKIDEGEEFVDPGFSASDAEDGDLTASVTFVSDIDNTVMGSYTVTYTVTDSDNNTVTITRSVAVTEATDNMPVLHVIGEDSYVIEVNETFTNPSATGWDFEDEDITDSITIESDLDVSTAGIYYLIYSLTDSDNNTVTKTIEVSVTSDNTYPVISVVQDFGTLLLDSVYDPFEYTAFDEEDGDITASVIVEDTVDTTVIGQYTITYTVTDSMDATSVYVIKIDVVNDLDTDPVITLVGGDVTIKQNRSFIDPGFTCWDDQDGDCTEYTFMDTYDLDITTPGVYDILYYVSDSDYNDTMVVRHVTVEAYVNTDPVLTLNGESDVTIIEGSLYIEKGAMAIDNEDGDISTNVIILGTVDTEKVGTYVIQYKIYDQDNALVTLERTVTVVMNTAPVITLIGEETIFVNVFGSYQELEASVYDKEDGDITSSLVIHSSDLDLDVPGTYYIQYQATDSLGKTGYYYRTVVVENNLKHVYGTVMIELGLDIDLDDLFTRLDLTKPNDFTLDCNDEQTEFMMIGDYGVLFLVRNAIFNDASITADTLIYSSGDTLYGHSVALDIYHPLEIELTKEYDGEGMMSLMRSNFESVVMAGSLEQAVRSAYLGIGHYTLTFEATTDQDVVVYSISTKTANMPEVIEIPLNDFVYVSSLEEEISFEFTSNGGPLQFNLYGPRHYFITIYDSDNNVILSRQDSGLYTMSQNFANGDYRVVIRSYSREASIIVYVSSVLHENYGAIDAEEISISGTVSLDLIPGFMWYQFDVTESGYYTLEERYVESDSIEGYFYTNQMDYQTTEYTMYFEAGSHYLRLDGYGKYQFTLEKDLVVTSTNNTSADATLLDPVSQDLYTYFDNDSSHKWYKIELTEESLLKIAHDMSLYGKNASFTLYNNMLEEIDTGSTSYFVQRVLPAANYYIEVTGTAMAGVTSSITISDPTIYSQDENQATEITTDTVLDGVITREAAAYFELSVDTSGWYTFYYEGIFTSMNVDGENYSLSIFPAVIYLEAGSHDLVVNKSYYPGDFIFHLQIEESTIAVTQSDPSYFVDGVSAGPKESIMYATEEEMHIIDRILVRETSLYYIQPMNGYYATVSDADGVIIDQGKTYELEDLILTPGIYTIDYTTEYEGLAFSSYEVMSYYDDYEKRMTAPTVLDHFTDLHGYFGKDTMDTVKVSIPEDMLLRFEIRNQAQVTILDENKDFVSSIGYEPTKHDLLDIEAGTYYFIINRIDTAYYDLYITDVSDQVASNDMANPTEVYVGNDTFSFYNKMELLDTYYTFTVESLSLLDFNFISQEHYEIYDESGDIYTLPYYTPGDYVIRAYTVDQIFEQAMKPCMVLLDINNFTSEVISNDSNDAYLLQSGTLFNGRKALPGQESWFTFTSNEDEVITLYRSITDGITLYDDQMNPVDWPLSTGSLPTGQYYIKVEESDLNYPEYYENYSIKMTKTRYVDAPSICANAVLYDLESGKNQVFNAYLLSDTDVDCYKFDIHNEALLNYYISDFSMAFQRVNEAGELQLDLNYTIRDVIRDEQYIYIRVSGTEAGAYYMMVENKAKELTPSSFAEARELEFGLYTTAYRETLHEDDYYTFTLDEASAIYTSYYPQSDFTLYDSSLLEVTDPTALLDAGQYYLVFNNGKVANYSFTYFTIEDDVEIIKDPLNNPPLNDADHPVLIEDRYFNLHADQTEGYYSTDYYQFTLKEGTLYEVSGDASNSKIYIYDEFGIEAAYISDIDYGPFKVYLEPGSYTLTIADSYDYDVDFAEMDYVDYSNDIMAPDEVSMYQTMHSYIFGTSDMDFFTLTLDEERIIEFNQMYEIKIRVYNEDGDLLINTHDWPNTARLEAGTYSIHVSAILDEVREYLWFISEIEADYTETSIEEAQTIQITDEFTSGTFYQESETGTVYVKLQIDEFTVISDLNGATLHDMEENYIFDTMLEAGIYLLKLSGYNHQFSFRDITAYYYAHNETATPLEIGEGIHITYQESGDFAQFSITPDRDILVYFKEVNSSFSYSIKDTDDDLVYNGSIDSSNWNQHHFLFKAGENYTLQVSSYTRDLNLRLAEYLYTDIANTEGEAYTLELNEEVSAEIYNINDEDWYTFTVAEEFNLVLANINYTLYESGEDPVLHNAGEDDFILLAAGTYHVKVFGATSYPYTIRIELAE